MSVASKLDKRIKSDLDARAVYLPGFPFNLGDVLREKGDGFDQMATLQELGISFKREKSDEARLSVKSGGAKERLFNGSVEVKKVSDLAPNGEASVKYELKSSFEYVLATPALKGEHIANLAAVMKAVQALPDFKFDKWLIVNRVYVAKDISFVATRKKAGSFEISGKGSGIVKFLTLGLSAGLTRTSNCDVEVIGGSGPVAMRLTRVKKPT